MSRFYPVYLVLEEGKMLNDVVVFESCLVEYRDVEWVKIHEEPVLMRGGDNGNKTGDEEE